MQLIQWIKIEAGEYQSSDGRFTIRNTWDRVYSNHWDLTDTSINDYYKSKTHCTSLKHAKHTAQTIVDRENGKYKFPEITADML